MKNLYDPARVAEIKARLASLRSDSARLWGKMDAPQAVAHCAVAMEWALGETRPPRLLMARIAGRIVKPFVFRDDGPMRPNSPTSPDLIIKDGRDLIHERDLLCARIDRFFAGGPSACTTHSHPFFGHLTPEEWAVLMYKHLDHHLRQFGV